MNETVNTGAAYGWALNRTDSDDLRHSLRISVWVRWFVVITWLAQHNYRPDFDSHTYLQNMLLAVALLALNGYVHHRIRSVGAVTWPWALALNAMDVITITTGLAISGGFQNGFFVLYYPALASFAVVFASFRLSFVWVTIVAAVYAALSLTLYTGIDFEAKIEKTLFIRIVTMYAVVTVVNLIYRFERIRRRAAVERERDLQRERIELSQSIHDTIAQSAYMIGLGVETAIELAGDSNEELIAKLKATHSLSKSTMWELRHPIDAGPIFEGRELSRVLRSHASTFTTITSIPTEMVQTGREPQLSAVTTRLLFSIAHNALTNAFRHANARKVTVSLNFGDDRLRMSVSDDGVGLPDDYEDRGHGFRNMRTDAERMGGRLEATSGESGHGTAVIIMDVMMPLKNGIDACREITDMLPETKVLILTASAEEDAVLEAVAAGATGYLQKYSGKEKLLVTVRDVADGEYRIPGDVIKSVFAGIRAVAEQRRTQELDRLTQRDREILTLFAQGLSYAQIAQARSNQPLTIRNAIYGIQDKLGIETKQELVVWAVRNGLLDDYQIGM